MARYVLRIVEGSAFGQEIPLAAPIEIGRDPTLGVPLVDDPLVSRRHARLIPTGEGVVVEDLGSSNGTLVNGVPIDKATLLRPGERLLVGDTALELGRAPVATPTPERPPEDARLVGPGEGARGEPAPAPERGGVFERLALLADRRHWVVLALTVLFVAVSAAFGATVATRLASGGSPVEDPSSDSILARERLTNAAGANPDVSVLALVSTGQNIDSPAARARVEEVAQEIGSDPAVAQVLTYYGTNNPALVSNDKRSTLVAAFLKPVSSQAQVDAAERIENALEDEPDVLLGGGDISSIQVSDQVEKDLARAEMIGFPILFVLAFFVFRGVAAALLPMIAGVISIFGGFLGLRIVNEFVDLSIFALNLVIAIGLGLAIDYSLFIVSRYREELQAVGPGREALKRTLATAGRTVAFSAFTVGAALASLLAFPQPFLYSMGAGGIIVSVIAAGAALIVLPAILAVLGNRVNAFAPKRWKQAGERVARAESRGFWYRLSRIVMRHPGWFAAATAAVMIAVGIPFLGIKFIGVDASVLPESASAREVFEAVNTEFPPNRTSPIYIVAEAPASASGEVESFAEELQGLPGAAAVVSPQPVGDGLWRVDVISEGLPLTDASQDLVRDIRGVEASFPLDVGGDAASFVDQQESLAAHLPLALGILCATTLVILFAMTGSVVLPVKTLVMNVLTVSAVFGLLVLIFQDGRLEGLLGYVSQGALNSTQPLLIGAVTFALSTDYGVFLLTRIKEARDAGATNEEAVARGLERTGRIVTAAALLFCIAIGAFTLSKIVFIKQIGIGIALGVLIDATLVRGLLVPSLMKLLGEWNWWAPAPLRRLHDRFGLSEGPRPAPSRPGDL